MAVDSDLTNNVRTINAMEHITHYSGLTAEMVRNALKSPAKKSMGQMEERVAEDVSVRV